MRNLDMEKTSPTILVVEDEVLLARDLVRCLAASGYDVVAQVNHGEEAVKKARDARPDLILFDIDLSGTMDGTECVQEILSFHDTAIVCLTADHAVDPLDTTGLAHPVAFLSKPVSRHELVRTVKVALAQHRLEKRLRESEERFRLLYERAPLGYQSLDETGCFLEVNQAWLDTLGYAREEVIGKSFAQFLAPAYVEQFHDAFSRFKSEDEISNVTFEMVKKDGSRIIVSIYGKIGRDEDGRFRQTHCILHDIADQSMADTSLQAFRDLSAALSEVSDLPTALELGLETALKLSGMDAARAYLVNEDSSLELAAHRRHSPSFVSQVRRIDAHTPFARSVHEKRPVYSYQEGNVIHCDAFQREGLQTTSLIPVVHQDRAIACFNISSRTLREVPFHTRYSLEAVANQIEKAVVRIRADQEIREANARLEKAYQELEAQVELRSAELLEINRQLVAELEERTSADREMREGEGRLHHLPENLSALIFSTDAHGVFTYVSPPVEHLLGYKPSEMVGLNHSSLVHPDDVAAVAAAFGDVLSDRPHPTEFRCLTKSGDYRWLRASGRPIVKGNEVSGVNGVAVDITDRKVTEEALKESQDEYRSIFENAPVGIFHAISDGELVDVNPKMAQIFGYDNPEEFMTVVNETSVAEALYLRPEQRRAILDEGRTKKGTWIEAENHYRRKNGDIMLGRLLFRCIPGELELMEGFVEDITERRRSEEALRESEERYRDLFDNSTDIIYTHDLQGNYTSVNEAVKHILGYTKDEFLNLSYRQIVIPDYLHRAETNFRKKTEKGVMTTGPYEILVRAKDGRHVWVEVYSRLILQHGRPTEIHGNARDITARKTAESERSRLVTAIEQSAETVLITDARGAIVYVNPAFEQITGYAREEVLGRNPRILKSGRHDERFYRNLWRTISSGKVWSGRFINKSKDGTIIEEESTVSPVKDESGRITNYVAVQRDVTNEVLLQRQLLESQKMEAVGTLAGGIAHDFNNLLQVINGYAEMALFDIARDRPGHSELLQIKKAARTAAELTQGLLTFSRRVGSQLRPVDLNRELRNVSKILTRTLPKMIDIRMNLSESIHTVNADPAQLQQVVLNLALNARDAMPDGGALVISTQNVVLDVEYCNTQPEMKPGHYVLLSIADDGTGIDEQTRKHIFDPFFTTKETGKGTGLGLSIAFGIVKSHSGSIACESEPGGGTTFEILLPAMKSETREEPAEHTRELPRGTETILLIDDELSVRSIAEAMLKRFGYSVITASTGREGLAAFARSKERIDLVILDLIMPEMSGRDCLREIMKISPQTKVMIASGYASDGQIDRALNEGARVAVRKPFEAHELIESVRELLDDI